jgi:phage tail-like protein
MNAVETARDRLPRYANLADGWIGLMCLGVEVGPGGELCLRSIPDAGVPAGPDLQPPAGDGPPGCALDACGTGYVSEPDAARVRIMTRCMPNAVEPGDTVGTRPDDVELLRGTFTTPRGLLLGPRGRLYVADADAVLVIDPITGAITGRWVDVSAAWCLAGCGEAIYVLDRGGPGGIGRARRFDADGVEDVAFGAAVASLPGDPVRIAATAERLFVVSRTPAGDGIVPVRPDGTVDPASADRWATPVRVERDGLTGKLITTQVTHIDGIAAAGRRVCLIDHAHSDLLSYTPAGEYIGSTLPARAIGDIWTAGAEVLWAYPRDPGPLSRHNAHGAWLRAGTFVCGPLDTATEHGRRELRARFERVPAGHLRLWTAVTPGDLPPSPQTVPIADDTSGTPWSALPADVDAALVPDPAGPRLFIGGHLGGDGSATPAVHQIQVGGSLSWLNLLPAVYRKDAQRSDFLDRYLRLIHSVQEETTRERLDLVRRFDPWTADDAAGGGPLDDLAAWLAVVLDERWSEHQRRGIVAGAFAAQAIRGTPKGLIAAMQERFPGLSVGITEPAQRAQIWSLQPTPQQTSCGCCSAAGLGFDSMLIAGPAEGAVVGMTAVVDESSLTAGTDSGAPLFADLAHRFHVAIVPNPGRDVTSLDTQLRALVDAEKPAHTVYTLCVAGPRARVGVQARVGIDAIIAGPAAPLDLDAGPGLDQSSLENAAMPPPDGVAPALVGQTRIGEGRLT